MEYVEHIAKNEIIVTYLGDSRKTTTPFETKNYVKILSLPSVFFS